MVSRKYKVPVGRVFSWLTWARWGWIKRSAIPGKGMVLNGSGVRGYRLVYRRDNNGKYILGMAFNKNRLNCELQEQKC